MRFKDFLREEVGSVLDVEGAADLFLKECGEWKNVAKPLWRIRKHHLPIQFKQTHVRPTKSQAGTQDIQKWVFKQPGWKSFPDRKQSTFCSTTKASKIGSASGNGSNLYAIYPVNGTVLAATDDVDFNYIKPFSSPKLKSLTISRAMATLIKYSSVDLGVQHSVFSGFSGDPEKAYKKLVQLVVKDGKIDPEGLKKVASTRSFSKFVSDLVSEDIPKIFEPDGMGCHLVTAASIMMDKQREVWFEGKYLVVPMSEFKEFCATVKRK